MRRRTGRGEYDIEPQARTFAMELPATPFPRGQDQGPGQAQHMFPAQTPGTGLPATTPFAAQVLASLEVLIARPPPPPKPVARPSAVVGGAELNASPAASVPAVPADVPNILYWCA